MVEEEDGEKGSEGENGRRVGWGEGGGDGEEWKLSTEDREVRRVCVWR